MVGWVDVPDSVWCDFRCRRAVHTSSWILEIVGRSWALYSLVCLIMCQESPWLLLTPLILCNPLYKMLCRNLWWSHWLTQPRHYAGGPRRPPPPQLHLRRSRDLAHASIPLAQTPWGLTGMAWLQAGAQQAVIAVDPSFKSLGIDSRNGYLDPGSQQCNDYLSIMSA